MKTTGIVRRMDELGRIVIPKEIRKTYRIKEGDPIEIFINDSGELVIRKHSPVRDITGLAGAYAEALNGAAGHTVIITDNDGVIAAAGSRKKEYADARVSADLYKAALNRKVLILNKTKGDNLIAVKKDGGEKPVCQAVAPILNAGDVFGCVTLLSFDEGVSFGQNEQLLAATAAAFIGSQLA